MMRALPLVALSAQMISQQTFGQSCVYKDSSSGEVLYLDALAHAQLTWTVTEENEEHTYTYTPCRNAAGDCPDSEGSGGTHTSMVRQTKDGDDLCVVVANFDSSVMPEYDSVSSNGTWTFAFSNGDSTGCPNARAFQVDFMCDQTAADFHIQEGGELRSCEYYMHVNTKWACAGEVYREPASSALSGGSIFCIILASVVFAYFVGGWMLCAYLNRKDGVTVCGNVPHITFWSKLPALTFAGCCFTKDFIQGLLQKDKGDGDDGLLESQGAVDDFAE